MTDRAKDFMAKIWEKRNSGADTEEQLVSEILKLAAEEVKFYNSQNGILVLDKQDLISLADELCEN